MKKGQLSAFLILGLVMLLIMFGLMGFFAIQQTADIQQEQELQQQVMQEAARIKSFSENCLEVTTQKAIAKIGTNGGYRELHPSLVRQESAVWLIDQVNVQPTLTQIKEDIEVEIENTVGECLQYETFEKEGLNISHDSWQADVTFARSRVIVELDFPISIGRNNYVTEYENFQTTVLIPFREMFETASYIINLQLRPEFKKFAPLLGLNSSFDVSYENHGDILVYSVKEKDVANPKVLQFATKLGKSELKKVYGLAENSHVVPVNLPISVNSLDGMARLGILPGTTINLDSGAVREISVKQSYETQVVRANIPLEELEDDSVIYGDEIWDLKYPVYTWGPDGLRFNNPQRLILYWDEDEIPRQGELGILYKGEEGWKPIPAVKDYTNNFMYTDLPGFSATTVYDCGITSTRTTRVTTAVIDESGCIGRLATLIVVIFLIILTIIMIAIPEPFSKGFAAVLISSLKVWIGGGATYMAVAAWTIPIIGGLAINLAIGFDAAEDSITFTPSCDQKIDIDKFNDGGSGTCSIEDGREVQGGETLTLQSEIKSCNTLRTLFCGSCKVKCSATYKGGRQVARSPQVIDQPIAPTGAETDITVQPENNIIRE
jgi:hypothetical protein